MNDQRKFIRYECKLILALMDEPNTVIEAEGKSSNLSKGGIKFSSQIDLKLNSYCKIAFDFKNSYHYMQGKILRKKAEESKGIFDYALEFDVNLSENEIKKLLVLNQSK